MPCDIVKTCNFWSQNQGPIQHVISDFDKCMCYEYVCWDVTRDPKKDEQQPYL